MLKIVVFDGGWGGELVANYLASELATVEIIKAIDWQNAPYEERSLDQICQFAQEKLEKFIGRVDLIVLGGYVVSLALNPLRQKYPQQKFVGMGINYYRVQKSSHSPENITLLGNSALLMDSTYYEIRHRLPDAAFICPDCHGWDGLIDAGEMSADVLRSELDDIFVLRPEKEQRRSPNPDPTQPLLNSPQSGPTPLQVQIANFVAESHEIAPPQSTSDDPDSTNEDDDAATDSHTDSEGPQNVSFERLSTDVVLILDTHFWDIEPELEELFGYGTRVLDFRQKLLHDVCFALGLRGVDGERSK